MKRKLSISFLCSYKKARSYRYMPTISKLESSGMSNKEHKRTDLDKANIVQNLKLETVCTQTLNHSVVLDTECLKPKQGENHLNVFAIIQIFVRFPKLTSSRKLAQIFKIVRKDSRNVEWTKALCGTCVTVYFRVHIAEMPASNRFYCHCVL